MKRRAALWMLLVMLGAAVEGRAESPVVATAAGRTITVAEIQAEMQRRGADRFADPEARRDLVDRLVERELLLAAAREAGTDQQPEVRAMIEDLIIAHYRREELARRLEHASVSESEVRSHYEAHVQDYARPERSQAAVVFFEVPVTASDETRDEIAARAEEVRTQALELDPSVPHFGSLATRHSDDRSSRYRGGVIGWLVDHPERSYRWPDEVVQTVFDLKSVGAISPVITTEEGLYLVRLVDRQESQAVPFERVRDGIRRQLLQRERERLEEAFFDQLGVRFEVEVHEETLATLKSPHGSDHAGQGPPSLPGSEPE